MWKVKRYLLAAILIVVVSAGWGSGLQCQEKYPTRPIDIIVPFAPGGGTDLMARIFCTYLNKRWRVPLNVINKPGGNTVPACLELYKASPDGYTLLGECPPSTSMLGLVVKNLPFKVLDRTFVVMTSVVDVVLAVPADSPFKTLKELEAEAKRDPGNFTWTSLGGAGSSDLATRQFFKAIGVDVLKTKPVMCQGSSQAVVLVAGGNVKWGAVTTAGIIPAIKAGTVRPLAIASKKRHPDLPDLPTAGEVGYPTVEHLYWNGFSGPPKLPSSIVNQWDTAMQDCLKDPEVISKLRNIGAVTLYKNSNDFKAYVVEEMKEINELWSVK